MDDALTLYCESFPTRILLGTAHYPSLRVLEEVVTAINPAMLTVALRRQNSQNRSDGQEFFSLLRAMNRPLLPNTAACRTSDEAFATAMMARELFETPWIKLEVIGDDYTLQPDNFALIHAAERLIREGFKVLPYCTEDLIACQRLIDIGCECLMPWAAPIGSGKGPMNPYGLRLLRARTSVPLLIDAGLGRPSHACQVMEWGFDGILLNTAIAQAGDPVLLARAFDAAVTAGRQGFLGGMIAELESAQPSTTLLDKPFWNQTQ